MQEREIRARFRQGDPDAVRSVYRSHGRLVYAVAYKVLGDRSLAEEATQQTFVKAWRAAQSFDPARGALFSTYADRFHTSERRVQETEKG